MASESASPQAPQSEVTTVKGTNQRARVGAYTDTALTKRNVRSTAAAPTIARSGSTTTGSSRPAYAADKEPDHLVRPTNPTAVVPAQAPNSWVPDRDLYAVDGAVGQPFLTNQAT